MDLCRTPFQQRLRRAAQGTRAVDDIVIEDAHTAFHIAQHVHFGHDPGFLAPLVDHRKIGIDHLRKGTRADHAAHIRRDDHQALAPFGHHALGVVREHGRGVEVVDGNVEEALNLTRMQIDRQHAVGPRFGDEIGNQLGCDGRARRVLAILPCVAEIRNHRRYAARRGALERVDDDQKLHEAVIRGTGGWLNNEDILAAHVVVDFDPYFRIGKLLDPRIRNRSKEFRGDAVRERAVGITAEQLDVRIRFHVHIRRSPEIRAALGARRF